VVSLVDADLRPVPFGAPGELLLGGEGVGTGYVGLPEITAHAFVTLDPPRFGRRAFYRTGDLARYRSDGEIEFLGRIDAQVKIRGFRIEPGEVQSALEALASVRQAHVRVKGEGSNRRLIAYIVPVDPVRADDAGFAATLREALAGRLPDYMIPSAHMVLASLPMTPGGKIDIRALPEPELTVARRHREPSTGEERVLASIWSDLFAVEVVGVDDDFFERGGHSLLAMRVAARLRQEWSIDVPLRVVFERSRLSDLARWCADARRPANAEA
jgi:acyl-coenzyme A synthetase/AMP-(fatty) acid ligase